MRVYDWNGSIWIQVGADIDGEAAFDRSGRAVALSADGGRLAAGANRNAGSGGGAFTHLRPRLAGLYSRGSATLIERKPPVLLPLVSGN